MRKNKNNVELRTALPELYRDLSNNYIYQLVKIIFSKSNRLKQIDAFYSINRASKKISNMDVWFALRSIYKHFCSVETNFQYKKHFRFPEIFDKENVIIHLNKMYEKFILQKFNWQDLSKDNDLFSYYLCYLEAFIRSLYDSDFGYDYARFFMNTLNDLHQTDYENNGNVTQTFVVPNISLKGINIFH